MNLKPLSIEGPSAFKARRLSENEANGFQRALATSRLQRGRDYSREERFGPLQGTPARLVPPPKGAKPKKALPEILGRAFSWLRGQAPAPKRLRLAETVALGEKRFVAIIHAEGHKHLVGGGASGVALLTELGEPAKPINNLESCSELIEAAG